VSNKATRFQIKSADGNEVVRYSDLGPVLSLAITRAVTSDKGGRSWVVSEYDDDIYRITRGENSNVVTITDLTRREP
jgi:hypothetical protein